MPKQKELSIEQLERKIKSLKTKREKSYQLLAETEAIKNPKQPLVKQTDIAMHRFDIANLNAEIMIYEEKLRKAVAEAQNQPQ